MLQGLLEDIKGLKSTSTMEALNETIQNAKKRRAIVETRWTDVGRRYNELRLYC